MESIIAWLLTKTWWISLPLITFFVLALVSPYGKLWQNEADRKRQIGTLITNGGKARYRRVMTTRLDWLDARLSGREIEAGWGQKRRAWSFGLINVVMILAVAYPIASFVVQWIAGGALALGHTVILPAGTGWQRMYVAVWLGVPILFSGIAITKSEIQWRLPLFIAAIGFLLGGALLSSQFGISPQVELPFLLALAGAVTVLYAVVGAVVGAVVVAVAVVFVFVFALAGAGAVTVTVLYAGAGAYEGAYVGAVAVVVAVKVAVDYLNRRTQYHPVISIVYLVFLLALAAITLRTLPLIAEDRWPDVSYLMLFFGVFPSINALADFASIGLTRYLLRKGLTGLTWLQSLIDLLGGLVIFGCLGAGLITYVHFVRTVDGRALLDLPGMFAGLEQNKGDYWWLAFMLISTLIPTALHLMVGVGTVLVQYPAPLRRWVAAKLESGGNGMDTDGWQGSWAVCAMITASICVPIIGFYLILTLNHGWVLDQTIGVFKWYTGLIGAI